MPKAEDETEYRKMDGDDEWERTGVFAPQNRKKLGICAGVTVAIAGVAAVVAALVSAGPKPSPEPVTPLSFAGGFFIDPKHAAHGTLNGAQ